MSSARTVPDQGIQIRDASLSWTMAAGETIHVRVARQDATTNGMFKLGWNFTVQLLGDVDDGDLSDLAGELGIACGSTCYTNFNADGMVDETDLSMLATNYDHMENP